MTANTPFYGQNPVNYAIVVGTSSIPVLGANPNRKQLIFHNPHGTFQVAVCCALKSDGTNQAAVMNGAGSFVILPLSTLIFDQQPVQAWNAISNNAAGQLTIFEVL